MKKLIAALASVALMQGATEAQAQILSGFDWMPPYKLGVTVGLNVPSFSESYYSSTVGLQAGVNLMVDGSDLVKNSYGRVELKYSMKGASYNHWDSDPMRDHEAYFTTHYLELPIHAGYAWYINPDLSLMAEGGPYLAFGLGGTHKIKGYMADKDNVRRPYTSESPFFSSSPSNNRFDLGFGLQVGAMIMRDYQVHMAYDWGFVNMSNLYPQNRNFSIGFTYYFE